MHLVWSVCVFVFESKSFVFFMYGLYVLYTIDHIKEYRNRGRRRTRYRRVPGKEVEHLVHYNRYMVILNELDPCKYPFRFHAICT